MKELLKSLATFWLGAKMCPTDEPSKDWKEGQIESQSGIFWALKSLLNW